jgi:methyl-accepting chemotaxis protein
MKFINNMKIGLRLNIILSLIMVITMSLLGVYTINIGKSTSTKDADKQMTEQVADLSKMIEIQNNERQIQIDAALEMTVATIQNLGGIEFNNEKLYLNESDLSLNHDFVDELSRITKGTSISLFEKTTEGFKRISTSIINKNGVRSTGSVVLNSSNVAQAISSNQRFSGRAIVIDEWFLTAYTPIIVSNKVVGMIGVGLVEKDLTELKDIFNGKQYFKTGYPYLADANGLVIIHPTLEGQDLSKKEIFKLLTSNKSGEISKNSYLWEGDQKYVYSKYIDTIDSFVAIGVTQEEFFEAVNKTRTAIIIAVFIGVLFFILINSLISRNITKALNMGVKFAEKIAAGDLRTNIDIDQKDEIGLLAGSLNTMVIKLREIVTSIISGASNVASASLQVGSATQQLSQGATEQASSTEEISSSMEEMASNIQQNTDNSQQTEKIAISASEGISKVANAAEESLISIRQISEKITIINDIAFQTNILALNAAVEAARAGEHGKGFAVVAAEVRKLAERSKIAADEINNLSKHSLQTTEGAGVLVAEILPEIQKTANLVQDISAASLEQNAGAEQINEAIQQLSQVTQQNAAASEEMATSSEELASQADQLNEIVGFFKIDDGSMTYRKKNTSLKQFKSVDYKTKKSVFKNEPKKSGSELKGFDLKLTEKDDIDNEFESF